MPWTAGLNVTVNLDDEHVAMLDAIRGKRSRAQTAKALIDAILEDDAAAHGAFSSPDDKIVILRDWRRA